MESAGKREWLTRTEMLLGEEAMERLCVARVAVFGLGGVGGYTAEALARSGIGTLDLVDPDRIEETNLNRQILATRQTIGRFKADVAAERVRAINPDATVFPHRVFFLPDTADSFDFLLYDYIVDAIDTVTGKVELIVRAKAAGTPIISCMGAGNRMDASAFAVEDLSETSVCPMARVMRRELKKRGIEHLKVISSREPVIKPDRGEPGPEDMRQKQIPASNAFAPGVAGLLLAGEVIKDLIHAEGTVGDVSAGEPRSV